MPKLFEYTNNSKIEGDNTKFFCNLFSQQCSHIAATKKKNRCRRYVITGYEYCATHLATNLKLKIMKSSLPNSTLGLFVYDPNRYREDIIFKKGDLICYYGGFHIDGHKKAELYGRYNDLPYGVKVPGKNHPTFLDSGCDRSVASNVNAITDKSRVNAFIGIKLKAKTKDKDKVQLKALRDIYNFEEIFIEKNEQYPENNKHATYSTTTLTDREYEKRTRRLFNKENYYNW